MKMQYPQSWPILSRFVSQIQSRVMRSPRVSMALKTYGEFTDADVRKALGPGTYPEVRVGRLKPHELGTTPDIGEHFVLNQVIVAQFEQLIFLARNYGGSPVASPGHAQIRREWDALVARAQLSMEALILHEMVHWGDGNVKRHHKNPDKGLYQDGTAKAAGFEDRGFQFVGAAYGNRFAWGKNDAGKLLNDHDIPGWMGIFKQGDDYYIYNPVSPSSPGEPMRPPSLKKRGRVPMSM